MWELIYGVQISLVFQDIVVLILELGWVDGDYARRQSRAAFLTPQPPACSMHTSCGNT